MRSRFCQLAPERWFRRKRSKFIYFFSLVSSFSDAISSANPRVIDDSRARKLSNDLKRCTYYETCATYGLNVERVFQDGKKPQRRVVRESESSPLGR